MSSDHALEAVYRGILARSQPRSQDPPKSAKALKGETKGRKPVALCIHGKRKWPNKRMPHCGPCWTIYMRQAKRKSLRALSNAMKLAEGNRGK